MAHLWKNSESRHQWFFVWRERGERYAITDIGPGMGGRAAKSLMLFGNVYVFSYIYLILVSPTNA